MNKYAKIFYKNRSGEIKKIVEKNFFNNAPDVISKKNTDIEVTKSILPFTDKYNIEINPKDKYDIGISGKSHADNVDFIDTFSAQIKRKGGKYIAEPLMVFVRPPYKGHGIGKHTVDSLMKSFKKLDVDKVEFHPAFDGPNTWIKLDKFKLDKKSKKRFLNKYKEYTEARNMKFKDLGNDPSNYPEDFLRRVENATFIPFRYHKNLKKHSSRLINSLIKIAAPITNLSSLKRITDTIKKGKLIRRGIDASGGMKGMRLFRRGNVDPFAGTQLSFAGVNKVYKIPFTGKVMINKGETLKSQASKFYEAADKYSISGKYISKVRKKSLDKLSPKQTELLNRLGIIHEIQESKVVPKTVVAISSHGSPKVLFEEHNILRAIKDKDVRKAMYNLRATSGDIGALRGIAGESFRYGESPRLTKAMKKSLLRKYTKDMGLTRKQIVETAKGR